MAKAPRRAVLRAVGLAGAIGFTGVGRARAAPAEITECTVIDEPGEYVLREDLVEAGGDGGDVCIDIRADDVTVDGRGNLLDVERHDGVRVTGDDVTVENVRIGHDIDTVMYVEGARDCAIRDLVATQSSFGGVDLADAPRTTVTGCTLRTESWVFRIEDSPNTVIEDTVMSGQSESFEMAGSPASTIRGCVVDRPDEGLVIRECDRLAFVRNRVEGASYNPFDLADSERCRVVRNVFAGNYDDGGGGAVHLSGCTNSTFVRNRALRNRDVDGFRLESSDGNRFVRNRAIGNAGAGFRLVDSDDNRFVRNAAQRNGGEAFDADDDSTGNRLVRNDFRG